MPTKVPLSMLSDKVVVNVASSGSGLTMTYSDGTNAVLSNVGSSTGATGTSSLFNSKVTTGMKNGDMSIGTDGIIHIYSDGWKQVFPAVYS